MFMCKITVVFLQKSKAFFLFSSLHYIAKYVTLYGNRNNIYGNVTVIWNFTGYTGVNCQVEKSDCRNDTCPERAMCKDEPGINNYTCLCRSGYTGHDCDVTVSTACFTLLWIKMDWITFCKVIKSAGRCHRISSLVIFLLLSATFI